jgi:hypothetical protein
MPRDTGSFICQPLSNVGIHLNIKSSDCRQKLDDDQDGGQAAVLKDKNYDDGDDDDCVNDPYTTEAKFPKTRPLTFKNFMDYCHDFASTV